MYENYLKEIERKQRKTGRINPESKTRQMGKQAHNELKKYPVEKDFVPFN